MTDPAALARLLRQRAHAPAGHAGATALLGMLAGPDGAPLAADITTRRARPLTRSERGLLRVFTESCGHERHGTLRTRAGLAVAEITAVIVPSRLPLRTRAALGITACGEPLPGTADEPLGRALRGLGVIREPLHVRLTPGATDAGGREQVICSASRLWLGAPVAVVTERIYGAFLDSCSHDMPGAGR